MGKFSFKSGGKFLLDDSINYYAMFTKQEDFVNPKKSNQQGYNMFFEIVQDVELEEGEGSSMGKTLKKLFWANGEDEDGNLTFPESGKYRACIEALADYLDIDIDDVEDTDELIGGVVLISIVNNESGDATYSNVDIVKHVSEKRMDKVKELVKKWKIWKKEQDEEEDEKPKKKKKRPVEEDVEDDTPKKKNKEKPTEDEEEDDEPKKKKSKPKEEDDNDEEEEKPKKGKKKKEEEDDDDDFFDE